jgi:hypothetical protein
MPWLFWYGAATMMVRRHLGMGVFVLLSVSGFLHPPLRAALSLDLGVRSAWSSAYPNYFQMFKRVRT